jgi:hypothetical protein
VPQRVLPFCVASNTDWRKVGITSPTVQLAIIKNLIDRDETTAHLKLTDRGHTVLAALLYCRTWSLGVRATSLALWRRRPGAVRASTAGINLPRKAYAEIG